MKLDVTVISAIAGYTAFRLSVNVGKGYFPMPRIFSGRPVLLTAFAYAGIFFLLLSVVTTLVVNPWWSVALLLFFSAILGEFVIISLLRQSTYIFSGLAMLLSVYLFLRYIF